MKIIYLSTSTVPSKSANSIHVMKMCQAFAKGGHDVTLITQKKAKTEFISDYEYYGVQPLFKIKKYRSLLKRGSLYITALQATLFSLKNRPDIVYGRNIFGCLLSSFLGIPTIVELHQPPEEVGIGIGKYFLKLLVSLKNLKKIVVISEALKKHISATYIRVNYFLFLKLPIILTSPEFPPVITFVAAFFGGGLKGCQMCRNGGILFVQIIPSISAVPALVVCPAFG